MKYNTKQTTLCKEVEEFNEECLEQAREDNQGTVDCERDYELLLDERGGK